MYCFGLARLIRLRACLLAYRPTQLGVPGYPKEAPKADMSASTSKNAAGAHSYSFPCDGQHAWGVMSGAWRETRVAASQPSSPSGALAATAQACRPESITIQSTSNQHAVPCVSITLNLEPRTSNLAPSNLRLGARS